MIIENVYRLLSPEIMSLICYSIAVIHFYLSGKNGWKRWPKFWKGFNWTLLGSIYLTDAILHPDAVEIRVYFRIVLALLFIGEVAYHGDTLSNMAGDLKGYLKRE